MDIYLPIAEISQNVFVLLGMGGIIGVLSGMFGVGGGFLMTPLLIFIGIPPAVAVGTGANQVVAASVSGTLAHWRRGTIDFRMGGLLLAGGFVGSSLGSWLFTVLRGLGQIDLAIGLFYVIFLGIIGTLMVIESVRAWFRNRNPLTPRRKLHRHTWMHGLPFKMRFRRSKLYISALLPLGIGAFVGVLSAIMGVGGGFVAVPAMIYLLGMPVSIVIGTSLYQITVVAGATTFLHAISGQTVDVVLAGLLTLGAVVGAQLGTRFGSGLRGEELRGLLAMLVLIVCAALFWELVATPKEIFSLSTLLVTP